MSARTTRGFTLPEMLVALTLAGLLLAMAAGIAGAVNDADASLRRSRPAFDREINAGRWLRSSFLGLEVGAAGGSEFHGQPDEVRYASRMQVAGGWFEQRAVSLRLEGDRLVASTSDGRVTIADGVTEVAFDYLLVPGADSRWERRWISPVSAPLAVRVRTVRRVARTQLVQTDTALYLIKARG